MTYLPTYPAYLLTAYYLPSYLLINCQLITYACLPTVDLLPTNYLAAYT